MRRKAGIASFVGTTIEWYDFYIYGTAAALVLGPLFFPNAPPAAGVLASFATFWVGFLARPIGGIVFGQRLLPVPGPGLFGLLRLQPAGPAGHRRAPWSLPRRLGGRDRRWWPPGRS